MPHEFQTETGHLLPVVGLPDLLTEFCGFEHTVREASSRTFGSRFRDLDHTPGVRCQSSRQRISTSV